MKSRSKRQLCRGCGQRPAVYRDDRGGRVRFGRRANHDLCGQCWRAALEAARAYTADELLRSTQNDYIPQEEAKAATPSRASSLMYEEFHIVALKDVYFRILKECNYDAKVFRKMLAELGAVGAVKSLLSFDKVQSGLRGLSRLGRLDLSVEHLVIQPHWKSLFSDQEREIARERLKRRVQRSRSAKIDGEHKNCEAGNDCPLAKAGL
jgi:hypothetical protein